jgi:hypothetical protein
VRNNKRWASMIYGYYNGENFVPSDSVNLKKNQKVLIMPVESSGDEHEFIFDSVYYDYNKTRYIFNEPYKLVIRRKKGNDVPFWYCFEDENLGIDIMEESLEEAIRSFYSDIAFLWRVYAIESDDKLAEDAVLLKNKVNKLVREAVEL